MGIYGELQWIQLRAGCEETDLQSGLETPDFMDKLWIFLLHKLWNAHAVKIE